MAHIKTYCRIKPSVNNHEDYDATSSTLYVRVPDHYSPVSWGVNVRPKAVVNHEFKFNGVFNTNASQEEVFNTAASSIVEGFLNGYNGTIFAYGQTGTGKTFTVEGAARMYQDRGLAPRSLSMIYKALASRPSDDIEVHVSYMEIYQEIGYDLLNTAARTNSVVTPFPKVAVVEGSKGSCIIRNLSTHLAATEDVAQSLLLQGQANRKIAETPMNQRSSRSHAVFSIYLTVKEQDSDFVSKSKLHLVDLAGSERVSKTGTIGLQLSEAKHINLSLHHLEGVIVALQREANGQSRPVRRPATASSALDYKLYNRWVDSQKSPSGVNKFVPYRNSLLTMVLRDSLGGNCQTAMIATISLEHSNLSESISTCRFSQRVACVTNTLRKNEEIDDRSMIKRLRKKIAELESEISFLRSDQGSVSGLAPDSALDSKLTDEDKLQCARVVEKFIRGSLKDPITAGVTSVLKFRECLRLFRSLVLSHIDLDRVPAFTTSTANVLTLSKSTEDLRRPKSAWTEDRSSKTINQSEVSESVQTLRDDQQIVPSAKGTRKPPAEQVPQPVASQSFNYPPNQLFNHHGSSSPFMTDKPYRPKVRSGKQSVQSAKTMNMERGDSPGFRLGWGVSDQRDCRPGSGSAGQPITGQPRSSSAPAGKSRQPNGKSGPYKTPFERKKEQEIIKLDKKIEKANANICSQKQDLKEMQEDIREQQLSVLRQQVSAKVVHTMEQLADQHAYIQKLKRSGVDQELFQQEELVKRQLQKRQQKMEKRLGAIDQELSALKEKGGQVQSKPENTKSLGKPKGVKVEERFSDYVRRDGKVDTRKVMEMLQTKDRRQEKLQDKLELEKQLALSTQVKVKEAATRQKLQEFKEKLKQSRNLSSGSSVLSFDENDSENHHTPVTGSNNSQLVKPQMYPVKVKSEVADHQKDRSGLVSHQVSEVTQSQSDIKSLGSVSFVSSEVFTDSMVSFGDINGSNDHNDLSDVTRTNPDAQKAIQPSPSVQVSKSSARRPELQSHSSSSLFNRWTMQSSLKSSLSDLEKLRATSTPCQQTRSQPTKQWNSAYSTQHTHSSFNIAPAKELDTIHSHSMQISPLKEAGYEDLSFITNSQTQVPEHNREDSDLDDISLVSSSKPKTQPVTSSKDPFGQGYFSESLHSHSATDPFSPGYFTHATESQKTTTPAEHSETESSASTVTLKDQRPSQSKNLSVSAAKHTQQNSIKVRDSDDMDSVSLMGSVDNITDYEKSQILENTHFQSSTQSRNGNKEPSKKELGFDGRKLGLGHRNFDEALSKMLGVDPSPAGLLGFDQQQQYDTYARTDKTKAEKKHQMNKHGATACRSSGKEADTKSYSSFRSSKTWGPEARNLSISERLASYLDSSSVCNEQPKINKFHSFEDSDISPYKKPSVADDEDPDQALQWRRATATGKLKPDIDLDKFKVTIKAMKEEEREQTYMTSARAQKDRVHRIRQARNAAEVIQRYWRKYKSRK